MNQKNAINVINIMKKWALENNLSLLLVGSVGYRSALIRNSEFEKCDDIEFLNKVVKSKKSDNQVIKKDITDLYEKEFGRCTGWKTVNSACKFK